MGLLGNWVARFLLLLESCSLYMSGLTQHAFELLVTLLKTCVHALLRDRFSLKQRIKEDSLWHRDPMKDMHVQLVLADL